MADLDRGKAPSVDRLSASGIRELVVAGQARCEAAFYPPSAPIYFSSGSLQLTLRCDGEAKVPEAFVYGKGMSLLTKEEQTFTNNKLLKGIFETEYAKVIQKVDGALYKTENWEIDLTGEMVLSPNSALLIDRLRTASTFEVSIQRGSKKYSSAFAISGRIPPRWAPCGGVGRR
jgi:hypothetical protein